MEVEHQLVIEGLQKSLEEQNATAKKSLRVCMVDLAWVEEEDRRDHASQHRLRMCPWIHLASYMTNITMLYSR